MGAKAAKTDMVVIGASMGGLHALEEVLSRLGADCPFPVVVVQHRSTDSTDALLHALRRCLKMRVREPDDKEAIQAGCVYIAPADYHLLVERGTFSLSTASPVQYARPSVDVLFESAADAYGSAVVAIVLTGANDDGARGASRVKAAGGRVIVQDPETADSQAMPRATLRAVRADEVLSLSAIGEYVAELCVATSSAAA